MNYTPEDRVMAANARHGLAFVGALVLIVICAALFTGCDAEDAANIAQDEQAAHEKSLAISHVVCATWICQKYHDHEPCGRNSNTACTTAADLTERTK